MPQGISRYASTLSWGVKARKLINKDTGRGDEAPEEGSIRNLHLCNLGVHLILLILQTEKRCSCSCRWMSDRMISARGLCSMSTLHCSLSSSLVSKPKQQHLQYGTWRTLQTLQAHLPQTHTHAQFTVKREFEVT